MTCELLSCYGGGRGIRTPINGFGDRCSAIELFPFAADSVMIS